MFLVHLEAYMRCVTACGAFVNKQTATTGVSSEQTWRTQQKIFCHLTAFF